MDSGKTVDVRFNIWDLEGKLLTLPSDIKTVAGMDVTGQTRIDKLMAEVLDCTKNGWEATEDCVDKLDWALQRVNGCARYILSAFSGRQRGHRCLDLPSGVADPGNSLAAQRPRASALRPR